MKTATKKELPKWKTDLIDSIIEAVDRMKDAIEEAGNDKDLIEMAITDFEKEMKEEVYLFEPAPEDFINDNDFVNDFLYELPVKSYAGTDIMAHLADIEEANGYFLIECKSLAEVIKFEAFKEELIANPYQFNLAI